MGGLLILSLLVGFIALIFISISKNQIAIKEVDKYISYNGINGAVLKERNQINGNRRYNKYIQLVKYDFSLCCIFCLH